MAPGWREAGGLSMHERLDGCVLHLYNFLVAKASDLSGKDGKLPGDNAGLSMNCFAQNWWPRLRGNNHTRIYEHMV